MTRFEAEGIHPSSFRDPSGFLFRRKGELYRQVNHDYKENYSCLKESGLYEQLVTSNLLVPHEEVDIRPEILSCAYKILKPEELTFISYPYEWSFSQLKQAALTTLKIQKMALKKGMVLKDATAYNIQFHHGKPILIDTLSFERYTPGEPWVAYRQFCQHFLAPLALMSYVDVGLGQLLRVHIDGIPLSLTSQLLPKLTFTRYTLLLHVHLHAKMQSIYSDKQITNTKKKRDFSKRSMHGLIDSLETATSKLDWRPGKTEWGDYYDDTNYSEVAMNHKKELVKSFIEKTDASAVWDIGANEGLFSRIASHKDIPTIAFDIDPLAVDKNYRKAVQANEKNILPLLTDLTNPSPSIGWMNNERQSLLDRGPVDLCLALALIHHLAISNNLPFSNISKFFYRICHWLIIEFVPKEDSQVQRLLSTRKDIFTNYSKESFESEFRCLFEIVAGENIKDSNRTLYLMRKI